MTRVHGMTDAGEINLAEPHVLRSQLWIAALLLAIGHEGLAFQAIDVLCRWLPVGEHVPS